MKTIEQQASMVWLHWHQFEPTYQTTNFVIWRGALAGNEKNYDIEILYGLPLPGSVKGARKFPIVRVLWPELKLNFDAVEEAPLPHVYFDRQCPPLSPLCLFDPAQNEWSNDDYIAQTTIPWTADWLACYEGWRATERWYGGGRHGRQPLLRECA